MMKVCKHVFATLVAGCFAGSALAADGDHKNCSISPVSQLAFVDTYKTPDECAKACTETAGCTAWSFRPHSFDKDMPGQCKLIDKVFKVEESAKTFCGQL